MKKRLVLKNKKRFSMFIVLLLLSVMTFLFAGTAYGYKEPHYKTIVVNSGDTLWGIAKQHAGHKDIRKYIYKIEKINNISDSTIYSGCTLKLPVG